MLGFRLVEESEASAMRPIALTIAGSDPSGGAGIQADLKTFHQFGVYGTSVVTLLTVQNTVGVRSVKSEEPDFVLAQLEAVLDDLPPGAAKTGALGTPEVVRAVARRARSFPFPLVVDPVMISKHGAPLLDAAAVEALREELLPRATVVTPNLREAAVLAGMEVEDRASMEEAARRIAALGPRSVLVKGGHLDGEDATDRLFLEGRFEEFPARRIATRHTHGTGCTYSAAICAGLALGRPLLDAVASAKRFIHRAIETHPGFGRGSGPVNHHAAVD
jgi:hydroxymethylpyrimidine/phosphomethylpyrimidine kinase